MIEKRLQLLEDAIIKLTIAVKDLTETAALLVKTNPDTSAFVPDVIRRRQARYKSKNITKQDVIDAFSDYCEKLGNDKGQELLDIYGLPNIAASPPQLYTKIVEEIQERMS